MESTSTSFNRDHIFNQSQSIQAVVFGKTSSNDVKFFDGI